jgi:hypothetical protein
VSKESGGSWSDLRVASSEDEKATHGGYTPMTGENTPRVGRLAPGAARGVGGGHSSGSDEGEHGEAGGGLVWRRPSFAQHQQQARQQARPAPCALSCDMRSQWWNRSAPRLRPQQLTDILPPPRARQYRFMPVPATPPSTPLIGAESRTSSMLGVGPADARGGPDAAADELHARGRGGGAGTAEKPGRCGALCSPGSGRLAAR